MTHALAYSLAVEDLTGTEVPARARWARVVLAELERLYNHVGDLGNICAGIGFQPGRRPPRAPSRSGCCGSTSASAAIAT